MTQLTRVKIPEQVMTRTAGDEVVLLDLSTGTYFGLDPVGARIWDLMGQEKTLDEIRDQMLAEYDVSQVDLEHDLASLVEELEKQGLISVATAVGG